MENQNIKQLQKLAKVFNSDNVITADEIEQVLTGILQIMSSFKKDNETLNADTKKEVANLIEQVISEHDKIVSQVTDITEKTSNKVLKDLDSKMSEIKSIVDDFKALELKDGKDADEEYIISEVLNRIELPEYKETILDDASQIKTKLETLKGEDRLDISAVKGADKLTTQANLDRAISILDQRTQFLINKTNTTSSSSSYTFQNGVTESSPGVVELGGSGGLTSLNINGTNGNGHIHLKHQASDPSTSASASTIFADSNGNLSWLNNGFSKVTLDLNGITAARTYTYQDSDGTLAFLSDIPSVSGYELLSNKSTSTSLGTSDTLYPTQNAVKTYADSLVAGLLDYRGGYDASGNVFPSTGGSGTAGAVLKGDMWVISVAGTLGGSAVSVGDSIIANVDTPGQTSANWNTLNTNITYVPEDVANKVTSLSGASTDTQYPSAKLTYDQLATKQATLSGTGFVKSTAGTISYDTNTYLTTSSAASTYLPLAGGTLTGALNGTSADFTNAVKGYSFTSKGITGGWDRAFSFDGSAGTNRGGFGAFGADDALSYYYVGLAYNNYLLKVNSTGEVGINTSSPVNKLHVVGTDAAPATTGSAANGAVRFGGASTNLVLDAGVNTTGNIYSWIQSRYASDYSTNYNLILNPNGGNIGIGTLTPTDRLSVASGAITAGFGDSDKATLQGGSGFGALLRLYNASATETVRLDAGGGGGTSWVNNSGNFGIGTNTPATKLDVNGTGNFAGTLTGTSATFGGLVTGTSGFSMPNGQYYRALRTTGSASINILGIESGTDNTVMVASNYFKIRNTGSGDSANTFTVDSSGNAVVTGTLDLGNTSDTTISRVSAGVIAVEGATVVTTAPGTSGNVLTSNGSAWVSSAPAGGSVPAWVSEGTASWSASSSDQTITVTNTGKDLYNLFVFLTGNATVSLQFNSDTGANYNYRYLTNNAVADSTGQTSLTLGGNGGSASGTPTMYEVLISKSGAAVVEVAIKGGYPKDNASSTAIPVAGSWVSSGSNITSVTIKVGGTTVTGKAHLYSLNL